MRRLSVFIAALALLGAGLWAVASGALAQDDTAGHPLVGSWLVDSELENPDNPNETALVHGDGTLVDINPGGDGGLEVNGGVWRSTGDRTAELTFVNTFPIGDNVFATATIRATIEVSEDGNSFDGQYTVEITGMPVAPEGEYGPEAVTGTRIQVEPMGTPVGPASDLFGEFEGTPEATPTS